MGKQINNKKAYKLELGATVVGHSWKTVYSAPGTVCADIYLIAPKDGRMGVSAVKTVFWFEGIKPGKTYVDIISVGIGGTAQNSRERFWIYVDENYKVSRIEGKAPYSENEAIQMYTAGEEAEWTCPVCGRVSTDKFCNECGESKPFDQSKA